MNVRFIEPQDPSWSGLLEHVDHDLYHLPEYVSIAAEHEGGEPIAVVIADGESTLLLPLVVRPIPSAGIPRLSGYFDAVAPYGYPHPLVVAPKGAAGDAFLRRALAELPAALARRRIVAAFVRLHPLLPFPVEEAAVIGPVVDHGETVAIDLTGNPQSLLRQMRQNHVRWINKGLRAGHQVSVTDSTADLSEFVDIYTESMAYVDASPYYFFSSDYFEALMRRLPGKVHLAFLEIERHKVCAVMIGEVDGIVEYHLGGTRSSFRHQSPMVLLTYEVARWSQSRGNKVLHLGGGVGGSADSLFHFKAGFSSGRHPFRTWRIVADPEIYGEFAHLWEKQAGTPADPPTEFFPAYRKHLPVRASSGKQEGRIYGPGRGPAHGERPLVIVGAGGRGRKILRTFLELGEGDPVAGFVDDSALLRDSLVDGKPVLGSLNWLVGHSTEYRAIVAVEDDAKRDEAVERLRRAGVQSAPSTGRRP
jgi:hypothetical protein